MSNANYVDNPNRNLGNLGDGETGLTPRDRLAQRAKLSAERWARLAELEAEIRETQSDLEHLIDLVNCLTSETGFSCQTT